MHGSRDHINGSNQASESSKGNHKTFVNQITVLRTLLNRHPNTVYREESRFGFASLTTISESISMR